MSAPAPAAGPPGDWRSTNEGPHDVWLFDLDNTCTTRPARRWATSRAAMTQYIERRTGHEPRTEPTRCGAAISGCATAPRCWAWCATTAVKAAHFLHHTHRLPGLEQRLRSHPHDVAALAALPGASTS
jgi:putative hydrolase of the HAD superfamily